MADLRLRISIVEKNERGQEVELVRKTIQFNPQVSYLKIIISHRMIERLNFLALLHYFSLFRKHKGI